METRLLIAVIESAVVEGQLKVNWENIAKKLDYKHAKSARDTWGALRAKKLVPTADGAASTSPSNKRKRDSDESTATSGTGDGAAKAVKKARGKKFVNEDLGDIKAEPVADDI